MFIYCADNNIIELGYYEYIDKTYGDPGIKISQIIDNQLTVNYQNVTLTITLIGTKEDNGLMPIKSVCYKYKQQPPQKGMLFIQNGEFHGKADVRFTPINSIIPNDNVTRCKCYVKITENADNYNIFLLNTQKKIEEIEEIEEIEKIKAGSKVIENENEEIVLNESTEINKIPKVKIKPDSKKNSNLYLYLIGSIAFVIGIGTLYFLYKSNNSLTLENKDL